MRVDKGLKIAFFLSVFFVLLMGVPQVSAQEEVGACTVIDEPGGYELTQDLTEKSETCIEITSDDVVFDGQGNLIEGDTSDTQAGAAGILVSGDGELTNVTVRNVVVQQWRGGIDRYGIRFDEVAESRIADTSVNQNGQSILLEETNRTTLEDNSLNGGSLGIQGIVLEDSFENSILENTVVDSNEIDNQGGNGINLLNSSDNTLLRNIVEDNQRAGIRMDNANRSTIENNTVEDNSGDGVHLTDSHENDILDNLLRENENGVRLTESTGNELRSNEAVENALSGIALEFLSDDNVITENNISANELFGTEITSSRENEVSDNTASENGIVGISLDASSENTVERNLAERNVGGIGLRSSDNNTIRDNTANNNSFSGTEGEEDSVGISLQESADNDLINNTADENDEDGVLLRESDGNELIDISADGNGVEDDEGDGIVLEDSSNNTLLDSSAVGNPRAGIAFVDSSVNNTVYESRVDGNALGVVVLASSNRNTVSENSVVDNEEAGIAIVDDSKENEITNNTADNNSVGVALQLSSEENLIQDNTANENIEGIAVLTSSDNNSIVDNRLRDNSDAVNVNNSVSNEFDLIDIGDSVAENTTLSFEGENFTISSVSSPPGNQEADDGVDRYFELDSNRDVFFAEVEVSYGSEDLGNIVEESLAIWREEGNEVWSEISSEVDTENNTVSATVSDESIFGVFGDAPIYELDTVNVNSTVNETEDLVAQGTVVNTGSASGEQDIVLEIVGEETTVPDVEEDVTLDSGEETEFELVWETQVSDAGEYDVIVSTDDDSVTDDVVVEEASDAFFEVEIDETNSPVIEGEQLNVQYSLTNTGDIEDSQSITLDVDGERDAEEMTVEGGETKQSTLSWDTEESDAGEYQATVSSENDTDTTEVVVSEQPFFEVEITGTNSPIQEGEVLEVNAEVTNTGGTTDTQEAVLEDFGGDVVDTEEITLEEGETGGIELTWSTGSGDAGEDEVTVATEDATDTALVEIQEQDDAFFDVEITETNSPVFEGDVLNVEVLVTNLGDETDTREVRLKDFDGNEVDSQTVELDGTDRLGRDDSEEITLSWETTETDNGTGEVTAVGDNEDTEEVRITEQGVVVGCQTIDEPGSYELTESITADGDDCIQITSDDVFLDGLGNSVQDSSTAILLQGTRNVTVTNTSLQDSAEGILVNGGSDNSLKQNEIYGNEEGIKMEASLNNHINQNVIENGNIGVFLEGAEDNHLEDNEVRNHQGTFPQGTGVALAESSGNSLTGGAITQSEERGVLIVGSQDNVISDSRIQDNGDWTVEIDPTDNFEGSTGNQINGIDIGDSVSSNTTVTFEGEQVSLGATDSPPNPAEGLEGIGRYFDTQENDEEESVLSNLELAYEDGDTTVIDEESLGLWKHDGGEWSEVAGTDVDTEQNIVTADEITDFSTFGAFGEEVDAPFFEVEIEDADTPVTEGETVTVDGTVTNTGNVEGTQDVELTVTDFGGETVDSESFTLGEGEQESFSLDWDTEVGDEGTGDVTVASENDTDSATVEVQEADEAFFGVEVTDTNSPVTEGDELEVTVVVENTGGVTDTQEVNLTDFNGVEQDAEEMTVEGGETDQTVLTWATTDGDAGTDEVEVSTEDDSDAQEATIEESPEEPFFEAEIEGTNSPVDAGDMVEVEVSVANFGDGTDTQDVVLEDFDGVERDSEEVTLGEEDTETVTLVWDTDEEDAGTGTVTALTDDDNDSAEVTVEGATVLNACQDVDESGSYELGEDIEGDGTCFEITADDVTLDGLGNSIVGDSPGQETSGVLVNSADDVTVTDVEVSGWDSGGAAGIRVVDSRNVELTDSSTNAGSFGVVLEDTENSLIDSVVSNHNDILGIRLDTSSDNVVAGSTVEGNDGGIGLDASMNNQLMDNLVEDNEERGIALGGSSDGNVVSDNTVRGSGEGIYLTTSSDNTVSNNVAENNNEGIFVGDSSGNSVTSNTVTGNDEAGITALSATENDLSGNTVDDNGFGISLVSRANDNSVSNNLLSDNIEGIFVTGSSDNSVLDNTVTGTGDGVRLDTSQDNELLGNEIEVDGVGITVERFSGGNSFVDNAVSEGTQTSVVVEDSEDNEFVGLDIGESTESETLVSFEGVDVNLTAAGQLPAEPDNVTELGRYFEAEVGDSGFLDIELSYEGDDVSQIVEETVELRLHQDGEWLTVEQSTVDTDINVVSANITESATYGAFGEEDTAPLFETELSGTNSPIRAGEELFVNTTVTNTGQERGEQEVVLSNIGGQTVDSSTVELEADESRSLTFVWNTTEDDIGTGAVTVSTDDDSASEDVIVGATDGSFFDVNITETNSPISVGEELEVDISVTNIGDANDSQELSLADLNGTVYDNVTVSLEANEEDNVTLTWTPDEEHIGTWEISASTEDDTDTSGIEIMGETEPFFEIQQVESNEPVMEGEDLGFEVTVSNTGSDLGTQDIVLSDGYETDDEFDRRAVTLNGGDTQNISLVWETQIGDGDDTVRMAEVSSEDDTYTEFVQIDEIETEFDVEVRGTNSPVAQGDSANVDVTVENTGTSEGTTPVTVSDGNGVELDTETVTVDAGERSEVTLSWQTSSGNVGESELTVSVNGDSVTSEIVVGTRVEECGEIDEPGTYVLSQDITSGGGVGQGCILITSPDVEFYGNDNTVEGTGGTAGVSVAGSPAVGVRDVSINNLNVAGFENGVTLMNTRDVEVNNVSATGNLVRSEGGRNSLRFDAGESAGTGAIARATVENLTIATVDTPPRAPPKKDSVAHLTATQVANRSHLNISVKYGDSDVEDINEETLTVKRYDPMENAWQPIGSEVDTDENTVSATVDSFSTFGVFGETETQRDVDGAGIGGGSGISDPEFSFSDTEMSATKVEPGETVEFSTLVGMSGGSSGATDIDLMINDMTRDSVTVELIRGETAEVSFKHTFDESGWYEVSIDGEYVGEVQVEGEESVEETETDEPLNETVHEENVSEINESDDTGGAEISGDDDESMPGFTVTAALVAVIAVVLARRVSS